TSLAFCCACRVSGRVVDEERHPMVAQFYGDSAFNSKRVQIRIGPVHCHRNPGWTRPIGSSKAQSNAPMRLCFAQIGGKQITTPPTNTVLGSDLSPQVVGPENRKCVDDPSITPHLTEISLDEVYRLLRDPSSRRHASPPRTGTTTQREQEPANCIDARR